MGIVLAIHRSAHLITGFLEHQGSTPMFLSRAYTHHYEVTW